MKTDEEKFRKLLSEEYEFPCRFLFKFIVPQTSLSLAYDVFSGVDIKERASAKGKYISLSFEKEVASVEDILATYRRAGEIPGLISL